MKKKKFCIMEHNHDQSEENKDFSNASIDGMLFLVDEELFLLIFLYAFERRILCSPRLHLF